ncbi:hypothetical protein N7451_006754 [Penicillium sp. IBT 35674x]|nr:hypothetical protein N7451_006754 [Penicillium sp. IBT 35674x]
MALATAITVTGATSSDTQLNFRPENVTLIDLYHWVGSYYNGTAHVDLFPYAGLAASDAPECPSFRNATFKESYTTVLGLTEPSSLNSDDDPVNAFLTLWPLGFNFSTLPLGQTLNVITAIDYALYSSNPVYFDSNETYGYDNFIWLRGFRINDTTACTDDRITNWVTAPTVANGRFNGTYYPDPTINLQFDATTANLTLEGYFEADSMYLEVNEWEEGPVLFMGKFLMTFTGIIDSYHSDVLRNDTATPTWLRSVGYQNNSLNVAYTSTSTATWTMGSLTLTAILASSQVVLFLCV